MNVILSMDATSSRKLLQRGATRMKQIDRTKIERTKDKQWSTLEN
jgi:hypothetical protein